MIDPAELSYILYQLGEEEKPYRAVSPSIVASSNFMFPTVELFAKAILDDRNITTYTRGSNPTVRILEKKIAALQGTEDALVFASGSAAISAAIIGQVGQGDHVICVQNVYSWTNKLLQKILRRMGVSTSMVHGNHIDEVKMSVQENTRVLYLESPTSHNFELQDIQALTQWAHEHGLTVIYDNSYGSPLNRKPVEFGIDIICHSATKYIGGHSDVLAGVVCSTSRIINRLYHDEYMTLGAMISPENAWLLIRSLRTLPLRFETASASCKNLVAFLHQDKRIAKVIWPFDPQHPQHDLAKAQLDTEGPLLAFELNTQRPEVTQLFCDSLKIIQMAVSWGGYESLIMPALVLPGTTLPIGHIRLYVGLEDTQSLMHDIAQALDKAFSHA